MQGFWWELEGKTIIIQTSKPVLIPSQIILERFIVPLIFLIFLKCMRKVLSKYGFNNFLSFMKGKKWGKIFIFLHFPSNFCHIGWFFKVPNILTFNAHITLKNWVKWRKNSITKYQCWLWMIWKPTNLKWRKKIN